ncbi:MBL fold metallo-hydrolase [Streptomyces sp. BI20]|uniref:MBL fold metallo-hydrolase n=1 Tax=Streptomyces sp. BI20 TaxID=3403460 RepID=UPI003C75A6D2
MSVEITWWGHATCAVVDSGVRVLTDPLFAARLAHLRRRRGAPPPPGAAVADLVLLSHLHADHLHPPSLARLAPGTLVLAPRGTARAVPGLARVLRARGAELREVVAGEETEVRDLRVRAVPAHHDGRRLPVGPQRISPLGFVVTGSARTWFAGDTAAFEDPAGVLGPVDVALVPVGGWGPRLGPGHLDPHRAAALVAALGPELAVPIHWGTYWPIGLDAVRPHEFHGPGEEFRRLTAALAPRVAVRVVEQGRGTVWP